MQYEPGLVALIKSMVRPQNVPLVMQQYDYGWLPDGYNEYGEYEEVGSTSVAVEDDDVGGVIFNKKAFAVAKEFTDQQVNLHHRQQLGVATTEATPVFRFDAVAFLLAESIPDYTALPIKLKWDAVVLVGRVLESYLVKLFRCAVLCANHGGRAAVMGKDLQLARRIIGE